MQDAQETSELPRIAVVVIGRNEGERLRRCLGSVLAMNYPAPLLEVHYVDSCSTDHSPDLARSMGARVVTLDGPTTAARGRNAGWRPVSAPFVLFLDGDTVLHPDFVRAALIAMDDPSVAAVGGHRQESDRNGSLYNAVFDMDWVTKVGPKPNFGGDALVRVEALLAVGGFNDHLVGGEEPDISRRMRERGYVILHIDHPMTQHDLNIHRFKKYWQRSIRTGYAYAQVSSFYARTSDPLWLRESRRNLVRGLAWSIVPPGMLIAAVATKSYLPVAALAIVVALPIGRTMSQAQARGCGFREALAYAVHAHLQHIPILFGQMQFWTARRRGIQVNAAASQQDTQERHRPA